eukprot:gene2895-14937_t
MAGQIKNLQKEVDQKARAVLQAENSNKQLQRMLHAAREKEAALTKQLREQEAATTQARSERDALSLQLQGTRCGDPG